MTSDATSGVGATALSGRELVGFEGLAERLPTPPFPREDDAGVIAARLRDVLGVPASNGTTVVREGESWTRDGIDGIALSWNAGWGPDTQAWLLRPAGETGPLPGVVALHCHSDVKYFGKEKIADGPGETAPEVQRLRSQSYGGRAMANEIARSGASVLVHDVFGWGSRRFPVSGMSARSERYAALAEAAAGAAAAAGVAGSGAGAEAEAVPAGALLGEAERYEIHAAPYEDSVAKVLGLLGTSWGGVVVSEDLLAVRLLADRADVAPGGVTLVGMSGGGARAVLASALSDDIRAIGVMSMMSTFGSLVDGYVNKHTWMMLNPGIGRVAEWPDIAGARAPRPLFVGFAAEDELFPAEGLRAADVRLAERYAAAGASARYRAHWEDAPHSFGVPMQDAFIRWHRSLVNP